jgi:hypothetical protein
MCQSCSPVGPMYLAWIKLSAGINSSTGQTSRLDVFGGRACWGVHCCAALACELELPVCPRRPAVLMLCKK